ncbi:MAG: putative rane protein [Herbinix sp.]|jgi:inhibitor of the pro-sigma K processing machinery|nr:putative rane protein [Herbinix sp.]
MEGKDGIMDSIILMAIIISCIVFIGICILKRRPDLIVNFMLRVCIGTTGIYLMDLVFRLKGYDITVGINGATLLTNGLLGLPGFLLLYGMAIYYSFQG